MTLRSNLRALGWVASELFDALWPAQAVRCALGRDYSRAVTAAGAAHDAAEGLNEIEAQEEVWEPRAQCKWCGGIDVPGHDCGRQYGTITNKKYESKDFAGAAASLADGTSSEPPSGGLGVCCVNPSVREDKQQGNSSSLSRPAGPQRDLSSAASASTGGSPVGVESPTPPAGVDPPPQTAATVGGEGPAGDRGIRSSAPAGHLTFTAWAVPAIATVLDAELPFPDAVRLDDIARRVAEHIEAALTRNGQHVIVTSLYPAMETGQDMGASMACEFFPQYQQK